RDAGRASARGRAHPFAIHISTRITRAVPAAIEERKKETGITGDHHCGATMFGMSRNREPSELWCIVDSVTAAMARMIGSNAFSRGRKAQATHAKTTAASAANTALRDS